MILSNVSIHEALDKGWIRIDPQPVPRRRTEGGPKCPYQTSAVDLRLGDEIAFFKEGIPAQIDLRKGDFNAMFGPLSETRLLTEDQPFVLRPQKLVLGKTFERVTFPLQPEGTPSLAARVEGKSSYARCGLLVHFTAPTIHAEFDGTITLELINLGPLDIALLPSHRPDCSGLARHLVRFRRPLWGGSARCATDPRVSRACGVLHPWLHSCVPSGLAEARTLAQPLPYGRGSVIREWEIAAFGPAPSRSRLGWDAGWVSGVDRARGGVASVSGGPRVGNPWYRSPVGNRCHMPHATCHVQSGASHSPGRAGSTLVHRNGLEAHTTDWRRASAAPTWPQLALRARMGLGWRVGCELR